VGVPSEDPLLGSTLGGSIVWGPLEGLCEGPLCGSTVERPPCGALRRVPLWVFNCEGSPVGGPCGCPLGESPVWCSLRGVPCGGPL
jgi:hypothetical protein